MELSKDDLRFVVTRIPRDIRRLMIDHGLMLGGGFIRETIAGNKPNDVDLFGESNDIMWLCAKLITETRGARSFSTENAVTVLSQSRMPVQFITRWLFTDPVKLMESFDFTVCQAVIWFDHGSEKWCSEIGDRFYIDLAARRLHYTSPTRDEEAGGSMMRVRKFLARGYTIQAPSLGAVIARVAMKVKWKLIGDEAQATKVISGLLREVDPNIVLDGLEPVDEHETINNQGEEGGA